MVGLLMSGLFYFESNNNSAARHILHVLSIPSIWPTCSGTYEAHVAEMMVRTRTPFVSDFSHLDLRFIYTYCHGDTLFHLRGAVWSFRGVFSFLAHFAQSVWPTLREHRADETTVNSGKHRCRFAPPSDGDSSVGV